MPSLLLLLLHAAPEVPACLLCCSRCRADDAEEDHMHTKSVLVHVYLCSSFCL